MENLEVPFGGIFDRAMPAREVARGGAGMIPT